MIARIRAALADAGAETSDFDLNPDVVLPAGRALRPAGVLAPIIEREGDWHLMLTKRSSALKHHPGQIAFPGGKQDDADADVIAAALREAREEIGLPSENTEVLGTLPIHETVTGFTVTPVFAHVRAEFEVTPEPGEVEEVFTVPLTHVMNPDNYIIQSRRWRGTRRHYFAVPYGPYYIWGATARMLRAWTEQMASPCPATDSCCRRGDTAPARCNLEQPRTSTLYAPHLVVVKFSFQTSRRANCSKTKSGLELVYWTDADPGAANLCSYKHGRGRDCCIAVVA